MLHKCPRIRSIAFVLAVFPVIPALAAQYASPPNVYSLTDTNSLASPQTVTYYRNGDMVATNTVVAPAVSSGVNMPNGAHIRAVYDLKNKRGWSWDPTKASTPCISQFGSWGNPFQWMSQMFGEDISQLHPKGLGTDTVAGLKSRIMEVTIPGQGKAKIWVDKKYGLLVKMTMAGAGGKDETALEVTQFSTAKPPASAFDVPARCPK
ncbi:MAG: hypothetical protein ACRES9_07630 [Gammaproteobacteria bacterium]